MKLGRKAVKTDSRTLKLAPYMKTLAPPPSLVDWLRGVKSWGMMLNGPDSNAPAGVPSDGLGDCTIAAVGHAVQVWSGTAGDREITVADSVILQYYEQWDGYVLGNTSTDNGGICLDVLNNWKAQGFHGHMLTAFADPVVTNHTEVMQAIYLFGGVYIGMNVPNYIMNGDTIPTLWNTPKAGDDTTIAGGHCVFAAAYNNVGVTFISWGGVYKMTWAFWDMFVDEAHCLLAPNWITTKGVTVKGFNLAQLQTDLSQIT
jgi:hypothetical protein